MTRHQLKLLALDIDHQASLIEIYTKARDNPMSDHIQKALDRLKEISTQLEPEEESGEGDNHTAAA